MAPLSGARALGWAEEIGSLVAGKPADLVAVDLSSPDALPCYDPCSHLVYVASRRDVTHVWVDGELRVRDGILAGLDVAELAAMAHRWQERIG